MNEPISSILAATMNSIKEMVDVNTIVGNPITAPDGTIVIPVSRVAFGFASGGTEFSAKNEKLPFGGGSGAGVNISPIAFLVITNGNVKLLQISENANGLDKLMAYIPDLADTAKELFKKNTEENAE